MFVFQSSLRPRNPLARLVGSILGLLAVLGLLAISMFAFAALLVGGVLWLLWNTLRGKRGPTLRPAPAPAENGVIDGEFTIVRDTDRPARLVQTSTDPASRTNA
ncbi:MAG TPA: hypothetical protein PKC03_05650 [Dokdonella sp.]|nr:hypothetical protein [Dokdonella sp.]